MRVFLKRTYFVSFRRTMVGSLWEGFHGPGRPLRCTVLRLLLKVFYKYSVRLLTLDHLWFFSIFP